MSDEADYRFFAQHIRGRVRQWSGDWWLEVVNLHTDAVINRDGPCRSQASAFRDVEARVHSARGAWMFGFSRKAVSR